MMRVTVTFERRKCRSLVRRQNRSDLPKLLSPEAEHIWPESVFRFELSTLPFRADCRKAANRIISELYRTDHPRSPKVDALPP